MNAKEPLGWSSTFMKEGLALFLLYLFEGGELPIGLRRMCHLAVSSLSFSAEAYQESLLEPVESDSDRLFYQIFSDWKKSHSGSEEVATDILRKLEQWISKRVEGIMSANRRNYYNECAAFVAAYSEVLESRGQAGGKASFMDEYKTRYSRRRAFHQELRNFG